MNRILFFIWLVSLSLQSCHKADTISSQAQLKSDTTSISSFLKSYDPEAIKVNTGYWYSIDTLGNGVFPVLSDSVTISYTAKLIPSLQVVDYSTSTTVLLSASISGLQEGLLLFPAGSYGELYIPSGLAFGVSAHNENKIPPNSNLLYEVKLMGVKGTRLSSDIATIDSYLQNHSMVAQHDDSGIRYTLDKIDSTTAKPGAADFITVTYTERVLNADTLIASVNTPVKIALKDQVTGWRIMLPKYLSEGSAITMYVPSGYAYGSTPSAAIPANSNLVYVVNLIKVN